MSESIRECALASCTAVGDDGECMEGLESCISCPNFGLVSKQDDATTSEESVVESVSEASSLVRLPEGSDLNMLSCETILSRSHGRIVFVAGLAESGKTTLLAELYEKFQRGPFAGYLFAGSSTLLGFEHRCFLSRTSSEEDSPETERTKIGEQILHLTLALEKDPSCRVELLFTDLAGELFRQARDAIQSCQELHLLKRADHVVLLVNGDRLPDPTKRHSAFGDCEQLLGRMLDANMICEGALVDVVITKYDKWHECETDPAFGGFLKAKSKLLTRKFGKRVKQLRVLHVAARPDSSSGVEHGLNLDLLFKNWIANAAVPKIEVLEPTDESVRTYDHFLGSYGLQSKKQAT